jgi:hypothetical protein
MVTTQFTTPPPSSLESSSAGSVQALVQLEGWLDSMRGPDGYGGPVAHWWQNCLHFTGAGLDWRYEGIILGYLALWRKTHDERWLAKARRAGDDLVRGQLPSGNFRDSCFELNPYTGGTPHEAAADIGLLHLADALRSIADPAWNVYCTAARRNLDQVYIARLWDAQERYFRDTPSVVSFVPNKCATLAEALFKLGELTGESRYIEQYALPTLDLVLQYQVQAGPLQGAIYQNMLRGTKVAKFFPYYAARCVPALMMGYHYAGKDRFAKAALEAMQFVFRWRHEDGSIAQVVYPRGVNRFPVWVAAVGDILRAAHLVRPLGFDADLSASHAWLLAGQQPTGGISTGRGFASQVSQRSPDRLPEFRDVLPVCGWCDKAFRYLAELVAQDPRSVVLPTAHPSPAFETGCVWRGWVAQYREDATALELRRGKALLYQWHKGTPWARVCGPAMMVK